MCDRSLKCFYSQKLIRTGVHLAFGCVYEAIGLLIDVVLKRFLYLCFVPHMHCMMPSRISPIKCLKLCASG